MISGKLRFTVVWDNGADLDLQVTEPDGSIISYSSPGPTTTGGYLERDSNVGACASNASDGETPVENVLWDDDSTPSLGNYRIGISEFSTAGCSSTATWTLFVFEDNVLRKTETGSGTGSITYRHE